MQRLIALSVVTGLSVVLAGCASMSEEECLSADWKIVGMEDGTRGRSSAALGNHQEACAKYGVTPDFKAYEQGREIGLQEFCKPARAFEYGRQGSSYKGVCPQKLETDFLEAYNDGRAYYDLEQAVVETENEISDVEDRLERANKDLRKGQERLQDSELTSEQRQRTRDKNDELIRTITRLETERADLLVELGMRQQRFDQYQPGVY